MVLNFPRKLYEILENESRDVIRWLPEGAAFKIVDQSRFEREIIPKYFRHNQHSSVQRQLNLYGFKTVTKGEERGAIFHPRFRRGDWEAVKRITRYSSLKKEFVKDEPNQDRPSVEAVKTEAKSWSPDISVTSYFFDSDPSPEEDKNSFQGYPDAYLQCDPLMEIPFNHYDQCMDELAQLEMIQSIIPEPVAEVASVPVPEIVPAVAPAAPVTKLPVGHLNVVNHSVFIDPDFDLDLPLFDFHDIQPIKKEIPVVNPPKAKQTCEMGVNTDISLMWGCFNFLSTPAMNHHH